MSSVLYVRIDDWIKQRIILLSQETGLTQTRVTEIILMRGLRTYSEESGEQKLKTILDGETNSP